MWSGILAFWGDSILLLPSLVLFGIAGLILCWSIAGGASPHWLEQTCKICGCVGLILGTPFGWVALYFLLIAVVCAAALCAVGGVVVGCMKVLLWGAKSVRRCAGMKNESPPPPCGPAPQRAELKLPLNRSIYATNSCR